MSTGRGPGAGLSTEWADVLSLSMQMEPLRTANEVGILLQAMRQYPAGLPDRASLVAAELQVYSTQQIAQLLERLDTVWTGLIQTSFRLAHGRKGDALPCPGLPPVAGREGAWRGVFAEPGGDSQLCKSQQH